MKGNTNETAGSRSVINIGSIIDNAKVGKVAITVIVLCFSIMLMDGYDFGIISNAAPLIMKEWHISSALFGPVFSVATFGWMIGAVIFGVVSDKIGRKKTLTIGSIIFTVMTLLIYFSNTLPQLLVIRFITGLGVGGAVPVAMTLTSEYSSAKSRAKFITIMFSGFVVGQTIGSYIAAGMMPTFGWRSIFLVGFFIPLAAILCMFAILPESAKWLAINGKTPKQRESLIKILKQIQPDIVIDDDAQFIASSAQKKNEQYSPKELFQGRLAWCTPLLWLYYLTSSLALFFIGNWLPQLLVLKGLTASMASVFMGNSTLCGIAGTILVGVWLDKKGFRWGFIWPLITILCTALIGGASGGMLVVWICLNGFFMNGEHSILTALVPSLYPVKIKSQGSGIANAVAKIGSIIGPIIGGILISTGMAMTELFYLAAIPFALCAVFSIVLGTQYDKYFAPMYTNQD